MKQSVIPILLITIIYHSVLGAQIMAPDDAVKISNSEYLEASAGTILWTGLDFQGLDGTSLKSLTTQGPSAANSSCRVVDIEGNVYKPALCIGKSNA